MQNAKKNHYLLDVLVIAFIFAYIYKPFFLSLSAFLSLAMIGSIILLSIYYGARISNKSHMFLSFIGICLIIFLPTMINPADNNFKTFLSCQFVFFVIPVLFTLLNDILSIKDRKIIVIISLGLWVYSLITTFLGLQTYPYASRLTAGWATEVQRELYYGLNIGGYEYIYATVFLAPFVLFWVFDNYNQIFMRCVGVLFYVVSAITVILSQYAMAVVFFIAVTIFLFVNKQKKTTRIILLLVIVVCSICLLMLSNEVLEQIMKIAIENDMISLHSRLSALKNALRDDGLMNFDRLRLYNKSITAMFDYPVIGGSWFPGVSYSEHSGFLDVFAKYGILGFVWMIYLVAIRRRISATLEDANTYRTIILIFLIFGFLNMFDIYIDISISIFMLIPLMLSMRGSRQHKVSSKESSF